MFCSKCGNQLRTDDAFCPKCGAAVAKDSPSPSPERQAQLQQALSEKERWLAWADGRLAELSGRKNLPLNERLDVTRQVDMLQRDIAGVLEEANRIRADLRLPPLAPISRPVASRPAYASLAPSVGEPTARVAPPTTKRKRYGLIGGLVLLVVLCAVASRVSNSASEALSRAGEVANVSAPAAQSNDVTPDMQAYFSKATGPINEYGKWMGRLGEQSTKIGNEPTLLLDSEWKGDTAVVLAGLREAGNQLGTIAPVPDQVRPVDTLLKKIAAETDPLIDDYVAGIDNMDVQRMNSATSRTQQITRWINEATAELSTFLP